MGRPRARVGAVVDHGLRSAPAPAPEDAGASADAAAPEPEPEPAPVVRASFALRAGLAPCRFVFRAGVGSTVDAGRFLMSISRIELEASEVCAAQVVYDAEAEVKAAPDRALEALEGGLPPNPGKLAAAAALREGPDPIFVDANFDGYLDLVRARGRHVVEMPMSLTGARPLGSRVAGASRRAGVRR